VGSSLLSVSVSETTLEICDCRPGKVQQGKVQFERIMILKRVQETILEKPLGKIWMEMALRVETTEVQQDLCQQLSEYQQVV
jgi:uncharacterized hydantoinase/oxoprolinase family protein